MQGSAECFVIVPLRKDRIGWRKYRTVVCDPGTGERFALFHRQANGHWGLVREHDTWASASSEAKRAAFLNHVSVVELTDIDPGELPDPAEL